MTRPRLYLVRMALFVLIVAIIAALLSKALGAAFVANLPLNVTIAIVLLVGILYIFRQVWMLTPEVVWIEGFRTGRQGLSDPMPRLMAPMAAMIGDRGNRRLSLSPVSMRTLLDGIAARLDEHRETSRYLIGVLVFLGLLGTFYGLLVTVHAVGGVIGGLTVTGGDLGRAMDGLKASLQAPLHGMATAFSSSLFGLAGSLVLGFLDLQAGQAQNRFFNELEEWLSGVTRLGGGGALGEGDQPVPAYIQALLEQTADSLDNLQRIIARGEESRIAGNATFQAMSDRLGLLTEQMRADQEVMLRLAEGQSDLRPVLARLAELPRSLAGGSGGLDEASRNHLRSLDQHVIRLVEEARGTREQTVQEIRTEIRLLARTIAALAETPAER